MNNAELIAKAQAIWEEYGFTDDMVEWAGRACNLLKNFSDALERTEQECKRLSGFLEEYKALVDKRNKELTVSERERDEAVAWEVALRDALETYGGHVSYCSCMTEDGASSLPCNCGFRVVRDTPSPAAERLLAQVKSADRLWVLLKRWSNPAFKDFVSGLGKEIADEMEAYRAAKEG